MKIKQLYGVALFDLGNRQLKHPSESKRSYYTVDYNDHGVWRTTGTWRIEGRRSARKIAAAYNMGNFEARIIKETF